MAHLRQSELPQRILVPIAGGPNTRLALQLAITEADAIEHRTGDRPEVVALNLMAAASDTDQRENRRLTLLRDLDIEEWPIELRVIPASDIVQGILHEAAHFDQIVVGASAEGLLEQSLFGSIPHRLAEEAMTTVIMVKRYNPVKFGLRRWLTWPRSKQL